MSLVLDCSITLAWFYKDERTAAVETVMARVQAGGAVVPSLWSLEMANGFQAGLRRGRINAIQRRGFLRALTALGIGIDLETHSFAWTETLALSDAHGLTIYDASYLELAMRRGLPIATLDRALRGAALARGIDVLPSVGS